MMSHRGGSTQWKYEFVFGNLINHRSRYVSDSRIVAQEILHHLGCTSYNLLTRGDRKRSAGTTEEIHEGFHKLFEVPSLFFLSL